MGKNYIGKGVTLLELIISLAILSIIIIPISSMTLTSTKIDITSEDKLRAVALAQEAMEFAKNPVNSIEEINNKINEINTSNQKYKIESTIVNIGDNIDPKSSIIDVEISSNNFISFSEKIGGNYNSNQHIGVIESPPLNVELNEQGDKDRLEFWQDKDNNKGNSKNHGHLDIKEDTESIIIRISLKGDNPESINFINNTTNKKLIIYTTKDSKPGVIFDTTGNVLLNLENDDFYRVKIQVYKKDTAEDKSPLQVLEGYKIIYN